MPSAVKQKIQIMKDEDNDELGLPKFLLHQLNRNWNAIDRKNDLFLDTAVDNGLTSILSLQTRGKCCWPNSQLQKLRQSCADKDNLVNGQISWKRIRENCFPKHTEETLEATYENHVSPVVDRSLLSKKELKKLKAIVESHEERDWFAIADTFNRENASTSQGLKRTAWSCMQAYFQNKVVDFTKEDDNQVRVLVEKLGEDKFPLVADLLQKFSVSRVRKRYRLSLMDIQTSDRWTNEEDCKLRLLVDSYKEQSWVLISRHFPNRNATQCRRRYLHVVDPSLGTSTTSGKSKRRKVIEWTDAEDVIIMETLKRVGEKCYAGVARAINDRPDATRKYTGDQIRKRVLSLRRRKDKETKTLKAEKNR